VSVLYPLTEEKMEVVYKVIGGNMQRMGSFIDEKHKNNK
jgi:hypothetical protein